MSPIGVIKGIGFLSQTSFLISSTFTYLYMVPTVRFLLKLLILFELT